MQSTGPWTVVCSVSITPRCTNDLLLIGAPYWRHQLTAQCTTLCSCIIIRRDTAPACPEVDSHVTLCLPEVDAANVTEWPFYLSTGVSIEPASQCLTDYTLCIDTEHVVLF